MNKDRALIIIGQTLAIIYSAICITSIAVAMLMAIAWVKDQAAGIQILAAVPLVINVVLGILGGVILSEKIWRGDK